MNRISKQWGKSMNRISKQWEKMNKIEKLKYLIKQKGDCSGIRFCGDCPSDHLCNNCSSFTTEIFGLDHIKILTGLLKEEIKKELMGKINE